MNRKSATLAILFLCMGGGAFYIPALIIESPMVALSWSLGCLLVFIAVAELFFRVAYRVMAGHSVEKFQRVPFEDLHIEPHPYRPYSYKRNFALRTRSAEKRKATYPLHGGRFLFPETGFNNFGVKGGTDGQRNAVVPCPEDTFRVLCLGASTTGNGLEENGQIYTYPTELERILSQRHPKCKIEIFNCGVGGYTSAEILTQFLLSGIDMQPDMVILYHAYNDLGISLTPGFASDYSHARKSLGEAYRMYQLRSCFPDLPFALYNYFLNSLFPGDLSSSIINLVSVDEPDLKGDFQGLSTYQRNLEHILVICKAHGINVLCSSFCQYHYPEIDSSPVYQKYAQGVSQENEVMRLLAKKHHVIFVDSAEIVPREEAYFVDSIHFSPLGMTRLATIFADALAPVLDAWAGRSVQSRESANE